MLTKFGQAVFWTVKTLVWIAILFSALLVHSHLTPLDTSAPATFPMHPEHSYYEFHRETRRVTGAAVVALGKTVNLGIGLFDGATEGTQWVANAVAEREAQVPDEYRVRISDRFGMRFHPILRRNKMHNGVDFAAPRGTPIHAVADGKIKYAGWRGGAGRFVKIQHEGYVSTYAHMSHIKPRVGDSVFAGDMIGKVGASGLATGNHLHFSIKVNGRFVNPMQDGFERLEPLHEAQILVDFERGVMATLTTIHLNALEAFSPEELDPADLDEFFDDSFL